MQDHPDARRAEERACLEAVGAALRASEASGNGALNAAYERLVSVLALGPAPKLRACPSCGRQGMADATRCGHCWVSLTAVAK